MDEVAFGRYRLIELLGRGGMGEVWRAHDTDTDRIVAIKVLPANFSDDEDFKRRFRREAHAAARLNTPHVVPIHNYGEIDGRLYVDMRLIEGSDLQAVLADGPLEAARAIRIIGQVALALNAAHKVGLLHRDVKPSNILLDENDFAYLIDFGIARAADETRLTKSGNTIGTFAYIAPERLGTGTEDARADIYSLACVLYECLTAHPPFDEATMAQLVAAHLNTPPPKPSTTQPDVPAQIDPVIATGMAKDPDNRYATTVELADAARDAITTPIPAPAQNLRTPAPSVTNPAPPTPASDPTLLDDAGPITPPPAAQQQPADLNLAATQQRPPGRPPVPPPRPADRPSARPATPTPQPRWRRKAIVIPAALLTVVVIAVAIVITSQRHENSNAPQSLPTTGTQHSEPAYGSQVVLPFTGLNIPAGVAVDAAGDLYVTDENNSRVLKLAAGSSTQEVLPFTLRDFPNGVAVDAAGTVYVTVLGEAGTSLGPPVVLKLPSGSSIQSVLPFTGLLFPGGVAVDTVGNIYVTDQVTVLPEQTLGGSNQVLKLAAGSATPEVLPFTGFTGLNGPRGVAVDAAGDLYVTGNNRVMKLPAGSSTPSVLPFTGLNGPGGVVVDAAGNLYVTDNNRVMKLAAGSATQEVLPFTGLNGAGGVAVDTAGNLYVTDRGNNRVLKLPAG